MAVSKLSQIASAPASIATTGFLVGVDQAGPTDYLFSPGQIGAFTPAGGNLDFYVATTGLDTNPGTIGSPFLTLQRAINVASTFDYQSVWQPVVHVAAGTYDNSGGATLNCLINGTSFRNLTSNFVIHGSGVANCNWAHGQIQILNINLSFSGFNRTVIAPASGANAWINPIQYSTVTIDGDITVSASAASFPFYCEGANCLISCGNHTITITSATLFNFAFLESGSISLTNTHIVLPASLTISGSGFFDVSGDTSAVSFSGITWTNFGGVSGPALTAFQGAQLLTPNGNISDIPGAASGSFVDATVAWFGLTLSGVSGFSGQTFAGIPTTSQVPESTWAVWKDTSGGGVYLAYNDAGSIKKVALT